MLCSNMAKKRILFQVLLMSLCRYVDTFKVFCCIVSGLELWHLFTFVFKTICFPCCPSILASASSLSLSLCHVFSHIFNLLTFTAVAKGECKNDCDGCINREEGRKAFLREEVLTRVKQRKERRTRQLLTIK